jgi:DNA-binding NarL/FixJ family response regulator
MPMKLPPKLKVLLLEDDSLDAELVAHAVRGAAPESTVRLVDTSAEFARALDEFIPDVILSDHSVGDFNALDAFRLAQSRVPGSPFILVSGVFEQQASECLQAGADDFVHKAMLNRLGPAITTAMSRRAPLRKLSRRQREVLQLLAAGLSTREIAAHLQVSIKTVETHRSQLMLRLGIHDVAGLVRYAVQVGVVSTSS